MKLLHRLPRYLRKLTVDWLPQFYLVTIEVHHVDKFAVVLSLDGVKNGNTIFEHLTDHSFKILNPVVDHEFLL